MCSFLVRGIQADENCTYAVSQKKVKVTRLCSSAMVQCFVNLCSKSTLGRFNKLFLKKERYGESYIARVFQWLSYLDIFTETSTVPEEAVAEVNLGGQGSGSVSEAVFHPDLTTVRQQIVGDVVTSGRDNGKN